MSSTIFKMRNKKMMTNEVGTNVRILMSNINNLVDFVIFDFVISDCSLIYIPMFAVLSIPNLKYSKDSYGFV